MQVVAGAVAGAAYITYNLPGLYLLARSNADRLAVGVERLYNPNRKQKKHLFESKLILRRIQTMTLKNAKSVLSVALCACLLSGCGNSSTSSSSSPASSSLPSTESSMEQGTNEEPSTPAPSASAPIVLQEETAAESQSESMVSGKDVSIQKSDLASYTETLSCFFHSPIQSTKQFFARHRVIECYGKRQPSF